MKAHNGMRPQDVVVLLKVLDLEKEQWQFRDLAQILHLSLSEIAESLHRSSIVGLIDYKKKNVFRQSLMEFITYGLPFVFPAQVGKEVFGVPTALSHKMFKNEIRASIDYVWENSNGKMKGLSVSPLYKNLPNATLKDTNLHVAIAAIDMLRVGKTRERKLAIDTLKKIIL